MIAVARVTLIEQIFAIVSRIATVYVRETIAEICR